VIEYTGFYRLSHVTRYTPRYQGVLSLANPLPVEETIVTEASSQRFGLIAYCLLAYKTWGVALDPRPGQTHLNVI
jgi:hypothetical protein